MERMLRFLKFVQAILDNLLINREDKFRTCIKSAYDKELGPYHNFFLRGIVKGILFLAPDRETFMNGVTESVGHIEDEEKYVMMKELWENCDIVTKHLHQYLSERDLIGLD